MLVVFASTSVGTPAASVSVAASSGVFPSRPYRLIEELKNYEKRGYYFDGSPVA